MQKNVYTLLNGPVVELSLEAFRTMMESDKFRIPTAQDVILFDNYARFLADVTCIHDMEDAGVLVTVNYGNAFDVLSDRDIYHELYSLFLHKNYPLVVGSQLLFSPGRVDVVLTDADRSNGRQSSSGYTRFCSNIPGQHVDTRDVQIVRSGEIHDFVRILSQKNHSLGEITALHRSGFSEDELHVLRKAGIVDEAEFMSEAWDGGSKESDGEVSVVQKNQALTGMFCLYDLEIDCSNFRIDETNVVLFEGIFQDNICLQRDSSVYLEEQSDFWVESTVMGKLVEEEFVIGTSLVLTQIDPDDNGRIRLKVANKLVNDVRSDHGFYM